MASRSSASNTSSRLSRPDTCSTSWPSRAATSISARRSRMPADAVKPGDCVFVHTGWGSLWNKDNATFGKGEPGIGIPAARWFIDKQVVLIGADTWGVEVVPNPDSSLAFPVHQELITKNGIHIHENLDTAILAADGVWSFC